MRGCVGCGTLSHGIPPCPAGWVGLTVKQGGAVGSRIYDAVWGTTLRTTTRVHRLLHGVSGGRLGRRFPGGGQIVWLSLLGNKSGEWRTVPLVAVRDDGAWVVTGSNAGQEKLPGWVFNARANPEGFVEVDGERSPCTVLEVTGAERDALYSRLVQVWRSYEMYERNAGRYIPVFRVVQPSA